MALCANQMPTLPMAIICIASLKSCYGTPPSPGWPYAVSSPAHLAGLPYPALLGVSSLENGSHGIEFAALGVCTVTRSVRASRWAGVTLSQAERRKLLGRDLPSPGSPIFKAVQKK